MDKEAADHRNRWFPNTYVIIRISSQDGSDRTSVLEHQLEGKLALPFEDRGERRLKNIARPVHVYASKSEGETATSIVC